MRNRVITSSRASLAAKSAQTALPVSLLAVLGIALLGIVLLGVASFILYLPVLHWLVLKMSLANGYLHMVALLGLLGLGAYRLIHTVPNPFHFPVLFHSGSVIWIAATLLYLFNEANIGFHTLSAALFALYVYGLAGHFISTALWRSMLLPVLLLILVLPFEHYLDIYLGFPLRLLSAQWASSLLQFTQLPLMTVESILMVDNKAAIVDLDCSGINSLWVGLIFYLLLTWVERFAITLRWVMIGLGYMLLLILSNVFRIVILVVLDLVLGLPELAQFFHQSLGLLGFVISSLIIWWVLHVLAEKRTLNEGVADPKPAANLSTISIMLMLVLIFIFIYQPYQAVPVNSARSHSHHTLNLPSEYGVKTTDLSAQEKQFFVSNHAQAQKYSIDVSLNQGVVKASMVLVWSRVWKTHHVPENCYISQGYSLFDQGLWQIDQQHSMRYLSLNKSVDNEMLTATTPSQQTQTGVYWFQSATRSTPDYSSRVMDNLFHLATEWVMVSILWDRTVKPDEIRSFITTLKQSLEGQFDESESE